MYLSYYNLDKKPFQINSDPFFLWMGETHREALAILRYGIMDNRGFLMLTGDVGTGKTTLINALINGLEPHVLVANIKHPGLRPTDFFNLLGEAFGLGRKFHRKGDFLMAFQEFLEKSYHEGKQVLIIIDEAQGMARNLLEEVRLFSNMELQDTKLVNIFLVGQDELDTKIERHDYRALRQRLTLRHHLESLSKDDIADYIRHRLKMAGTENKIFTRNAFTEIQRYSEGNPRIINLLCDHAMILGYVHKKNRIDSPEIIKCAKDLRLEKKPDFEDSGKIQPAAKSGMPLNAWKRKILYLLRPLQALLDLRYR